ncbi:hypothetical protein [Halobacterium hubeiense]|uniref:hypothetical protein n=1 Tax=Halobacterium hubeiense TaxID=1407499 RepID=UPI003C77EF7B
MSNTNPAFDRRTALQTVAGAALASLTGCLSQDSSPSQGSDADGGPLEQVAVDGTAVVVDLVADADVDRLNLIQPNGELFAQRSVAAGVQQLSFDIGTTYPPGEYDVIARQGEETVAEQSIEIQPEIHIREVGLFRNHPEKPWDEVYGESQTDSKKNGEAFVTVQNTGSGPTAITELRFTGDIPNSIDNPRGDGIYGNDPVVVSPGETVDLFSDSFPFGSKIGDDGMGCSTSGNRGQFTVIIEVQTNPQEVTKAYNVEYAGSDQMQNCNITISGV